jgi:co-chaperonin GroES (HSP10)
MNNEIKNKVMPTGSRVLLRVLESNPYINAQTESGLVITKGLHENPDDGNISQKDDPIWCAEVVACGPDCKLIRPGDHVYAVKNSLMPVPFRGEIFWVVGELNITIVIGDDLNERSSK